MRYNEPYSISEIARYYITHLRYPSRVKTPTVRRTIEVICREKYFYYINLARYNIHNERSRDLFISFVISLKKYVHETQYYFPIAVLNLTRQQYNIAGTISLGLCRYTRYNYILNPNSCSRSHSMYILRCLARYYLSNLWGTIISRDLCIYWISWLLLDMISRDITSLIFDIFQE